MASLIQGAQYKKNLVMHRGDGLKPPDISEPMKTSKKYFGQAGEGSKSKKKCLTDSSNVRMPGFSDSVPKAQETTKSGSKWNFNLTKEQIKQCEEWAEEGIERLIGTENGFNDDEVAMVMSPMHECEIKEMFGRLSPEKDSKDSELCDYILEVPEKRRYHESKLDELDEPDYDSPYSHYLVEFKLKDCDSM